MFNWLWSVFFNGRGWCFIHFPQITMFNWLWFLPTNFRIVPLLLEARSLQAKFQETAETHYICEAIIKSRRALELCAPTYPRRAVCLLGLAGKLWCRCKQAGGIEDIQEAIALDREALALCPPGHSERFMPLGYLALHLSTRYSQLGGAEDLGEAIDLAREALVLCPASYVERSELLGNLASNLSARYIRLGTVEDINEAIDLDYQALQLRPSGHPDRPTSLNNLASNLSARYKQTGGVEDANKAIVLGREALALFPIGHLDRPTPLNNLGLFLSARYERLAGAEDIHEAIALQREALELCPSGHPLRLNSLNNLSLSLSLRYNRFHGDEDMNEAILLDREALTLRQSGHPGRLVSLNNLAQQLSVRYYQLGNEDDANEAILLYREAIGLSLSHPGRPSLLSNFADLFCTRFRRLGHIEDINESIALQREALSLRPHGNPDRSISLRGLAACLFFRHTQVGEGDDLEEPFRLYGELAEWSQAVSSGDLLATKEWVGVAEFHHHPTTVSAYTTALRLLVEHVAALPSLPQHLSLLKSLASSFAVDAFSACLRHQSPTTAIELLEQGRGVFWNQLTRLRSPIEDVALSGAEGKMLADEYKRLTSDIRKTLGSTETGKHDHVCQMNFELQGVVTKIREIPGHSRFLLPLCFVDLRRAASEGPVIIVNASQYGCDALLVFADKDPVRVELPEVTRQDVQELTSRLDILKMDAKREDVTKRLSVFLRDMWARIVDPITKVLCVEHPHPLSRIWWCPTGAFSLLPLHAAGPYKPKEKNFSDLYVSSYTPSLSALIRARQPVPSSPPSEAKRFVAIGQANASGESKLQSIDAELDIVEERISGLAMTFTRLEGEKSSTSRVTEELGKNEWAHLACHGLPDKQHPFESAFGLADGHLTIERIMSCDLKNAEFAYLSACHTTVGDEESPDEEIHLAAAMQFAGFRSVIGTMWAVDDEQANKVVSVFYERVKDKSGRLDHTRTAGALWRATRTVKDVMLDQRVLYIHIGA